MSKELVVTVITLVVGALAQWGLLAFYFGGMVKTVEGILAASIETNKRIDGHTVWIREVADAGHKHDGRLIRLEEQITYSSGGNTTWQQSRQNRHTE